MTCSLLQPLLLIIGIIGFIYGLKLHYNYSIKKKILSSEMAYMHVKTLQICELLRIVDDYVIYRDMNDEIHFMQYIDFRNLFKKYIKL